MIRYIPLVFALGLCGMLIVPAMHDRANLLLTRFSLAVFGDQVRSGSHKQNKQLRMRAAHVDTAHDVYIVKTLFFSVILGVAGSIIGVYAAAGVFWVLEFGGEPLAAAVPDLFAPAIAYLQLSSLRPRSLFGLFVFASALGATVLAAGTYFLRWELLDQRAYARSTEIEATLPQTVAFIYALSRSGMSIPKVLEILAEHRDVYGEAANELAIVVADMNLFGTDVITALENMAQYTPSENMEEFANNLASVLASGRNLSEFLYQQYETYRKEAASQQRQYLELLSTFAEAYVTVLVAGPLFLITILVVIGLVLEDTLSLVRAIGYIGIPLGTLAFAVYVDSVTQSMEVHSTRKREQNPADRRSQNTNSGTERWADARAQLAAYDSIIRIIQLARQPGETIVRHPLTTTIFTVPIGILWVVLNIDSLTWSSLEIITAVDQPLVEASILVLAVYTITYEIKQRQRKRLEADIPDFLDRLASANNAGMTILKSFRRVAHSDLGTLQSALQKTWNDIQWGLDIKSALDRLDHRSNSPAVTRVVALVGNAMETSGDIGPVVSIAADQARAKERLEAERRQEMLTYLLVIYISFLVFLGIIATLSLSFIPAVESASSSLSGGSDLPTGVGITPSFGDVNTESYLTIFYHVSSIQAICSGLIAGQLGEGSIRSGTKHATIMLVCTYVVFLII